MKIRAITLNNVRRFTEPAQVVGIGDGINVLSPCRSRRDAPPKNPDFRLSKTEDFLPACYAMGKGRRLTPLKLPEPPLKLWGVQIAFGKSKTLAQAAYARRVALCPSTLAGERADYIKVKHRASGQKGFVMARVGRNSRAAADKLCTTVRASGCPCAVYANK